MKPKVQLTDKNNKHYKQEDNEQQGFSPLQKSMAGQRQFIYINNNQSKFQENASLAGQSQKIYFQNASTINNQQINNDKQAYQEIKAFKKSQKTINEEQKAKKAKNAQNEDQEQNQNQFLNIGKWQKNKSTAVSNQMKKMHQHLQTRLTQTKWSKKKIEQPSKTQTQKSIATGTQKSIKNSSILKSEGSTVKSIENESNANVSHKKQVPTQVNFKKGMQKFTQGISEKNKSHLSQKTSWIQPNKHKNQQKQTEKQVQQKKQDEQQQEDQEEQDQQQEEEEQDQDQQQDQQQEQQEQQEQNGDQQQDSDASSGQEGWDKQQDPQSEESEELQEKQNPYQIPETVQNQEHPPKASKWNKQKQIKNISTAQVRQPQQQKINKNISLKLQEAKNTQPQAEDEIQDLTQGQIQNDQMDEDWQRIQKILLRIQKIVN